MIPSNTLLYIYEIRGDPGDQLSDPPASFIGLWNEEGFSYLFFTRPEDEYVNNRVCTRGLALGSRHEVQYRGLANRAPSAPASRWLDYALSLPTTHRRLQGSVTGYHQVVFGE